MKQIYTRILAGIALTVTGLYLFTKMVHVSIGSFGFYIGYHHYGFGIVLIPFLISVVWFVFDQDSIYPKILGFISILLIILSIISSVHFYMYGVSLFELMLVLILIFAGLALLARVFLIDKDF